MTTATRTAKKAAKTAAAKSPALHIADRHDLIRGRRG